MQKPIAASNHYPQEASVILKDVIRMKEWLANTLKVKFTLCGTGGTAEYIVSMEWNVKPSIKLVGDHHTLLMC